MFGNFRKRIVHLKIYGPITTTTAVKVHTALKGKGLYDIKLIAVSINSNGGSLI